MRSGAKLLSIVIWLGIALLLATFSGFSWMVYSYYKGEAGSAIAQNKRVMIDLSLEEGPLTPTTENKKDENKPAAVGGTGGNTGVAIAGAGGTGGAEGQSQSEKSSPSQEVASHPASGGQGGGTGTATQPSTAKAKIAIIITGMGLSKSSTVEAMKLPSVISFCFSPYSASLNEWFQAAKGSGNEILLDLPLEPVDYPITDPGPYALLTSLSKEENSQRLKVLLALAGEQNLAGLVASRNEKFSSSPEALAGILAELKTDNLRLYFQSANSSSPIFALANSFDVPVFVSDAVIDEKITESAINEKLASLEKTALEKGSSIGTAKPYPLSVKLLSAWIATLDAKGIKLVPASEIQSAKEHKENP